MQPEKTSAIIKTLIDAFTEECLDEPKTGKERKELFEIVAMNLKPLLPY